MKMGWIYVDHLLLTICTSNKVLSCDILNDNPSMWYARALSIYTCYPMMSSQSEKAELVKRLSGIIFFYQAADAAFDLPPLSKCTLQTKSN